MFMHDLVIRFECRTLITKCSDYIFVCKFDWEYQWLGKVGTMGHRHTVAVNGSLKGESLRTLKKRDSQTNKSKINWQRHG